MPSGYFAAADPLLIIRNRHLPTYIKSFLAASHIQISFEFSFESPPPLAVALILI